jgi:nucleotide-binding universal stress UspA family protein
LIHLAYDGSINGDWVAWYAQNLARQEADHTLRVIYINSDEVSVEDVYAKVSAMESASAEYGVTLKLDIIPSSGPGNEAIFRDLLANVPASPSTLLICGARLSGGAHGYLAGTVSEKLLSDKRFNVMAVRVAQPGLLGAPHRLLVPVAGDHQGFLMSASIMRRFTAQISRVHLLRVMLIKHLLFRRLQHPQAEHLRQKGWESLAGLDQELAELTGVELDLIDSNVVVSDDWAHEVIIAANRHKSHLILMEAAWKNLRRTFQYGNPIEVVLRDAPCDVAIYRGV